jgi:hypothetical protein
MAETSLPTTDVMTKIEDFIHHYYNLDFEINRTAFSVPCNIRGENISLGNFLTRSLNDYLISKHNYILNRNDKNEKELAAASTDLITAITQLFGAKLITESKSLMSRFEECEKQSDQLKETEYQLKAEIANLRTENKRLHNLLGDDSENTSTLEPDE